MFKRIKNFFQLYFDENLRLQNENDRLRRLSGTTKYIPCPMCGGSVEFMRGYPDTQDEPGTADEFYCLECGASWPWPEIIGHNIGDALPEPPGVGALYQNIKSYRYTATKGWIDDDGGWSCSEKCTEKGLSYMRRIMELEREHKEHTRFWEDENGRLYIGYVESDSNFHYMIPDSDGSFTLSRSSADWPEPPLTPLDFREGLRRYRLILEEGELDKARKILDALDAVLQFTYTDNELGRAIRSAIVPIGDGDPYPTIQECTKAFLQGIPRE